MPTARFAERRGDGDLEEHVVSVLLLQRRELLRRHLVGSLLHLAGVVAERALTFARGRRDPLVDRRDAGAGQDGGLMNGQQLAVEGAPRHGPETMPQRALKHDE